jgi:hypothetical protein
VSGLTHKGGTIYEAAFHDKPEEQFLPKQIIEASYQFREGKKTAVILQECKSHPPGAVLPYFNN